METKNLKLWPAKTESATSYDLAMPICALRKTYLLTGVRFGLDTIAIKRKASSQPDIGHAKNGNLKLATLSFFLDACRSSRKNIRV